MARTPKEIILAALAQYRGDDLERARRCFRAYTPEQMNQPYGQSGKTPRQVIAEYEEHERAVDAAVAVANKL